MPPMHHSDGMTVLGFCNMLNRLVLKRLLNDGDDDDDDDDSGTWKPKKNNPSCLWVDTPGKTIHHPMDLIPQLEL